MFGTQPKKREPGSPLGSGSRLLSERGYLMIQSISDLWLLLTLFFSQEVFSNSLFLSMIILLTIFGTIYIFMWFFDKDIWGVM